jgi:hypothetical protein
MMIFVAAWAVAVANVTIIAQTSNDLGPYTVWANYGILGLIAFGFFAGRIVSSKHYDEMRTDRDRAREELAAVRQRLDEQILPALTRSTDVLVRMAEKDRE